MKCIMSYNVRHDGNNLSHHNAIQLCIDIHAQHWPKTVKRRSHRHLRRHTTRTMGDQLFNSRMHLLQLKSPLLPLVGGFSTARYLINVAELSGRGAASCLMKYSLGCTRLHFGLVVILISLLKTESKKKIVQKRGRKKKTKLLVNTVIIVIGF